MPVTTDLAVDISTEIEPPPEPKRKDKKWRKHPRPGALTKRGPARPYRRLPEETLHLRIKKLTERMTKARKQHEDARVILTKYSHERTYRSREVLLNASQDDAATHAPVVLPEFETIQGLEEGVPSAAVDE